MHVARCAEKTSGTQARLRSAKGVQGIGEARVVRKIRPIEQNLTPRATRAERARYGKNVARPRAVARLDRRRTNFAYDRDGNRDDGSTHDVAAGDRRSGAVGKCRQTAVEIAHPRLVDFG